MPTFDPIEIKTIDFQEVESQFGFCPECKSPLSYLSTGPQSEKSCCHDCKVWAPSRISAFGGWSGEDEDIWRENRHKLMAYREVEPIFVLGGYDGIDEWEIQAILQQHLESNGLNAGLDTGSNPEDSLPF